MVSESLSPRGGCNLAVTPPGSSLANQSTTVAVQAVLRFTVSLSRSEQGGNELSAVLVALDLVDFPVTGEGEEDGCVP